MEPSHTRVLVEAAYAAGAGDRREAAMTVLSLLEPVTHHDAGALMLWDPMARAHRALAVVTYGDETVAALGDRYAASAENRLVRERRLPMRIDDVPGDYRRSPMYREVLDLPLRRRHDHLPLLGQRCVHGHAALLRGGARRVP